MFLSDFNYNLPEELIARYPVFPRSSSRLLCVNKATKTFNHRHFSDLPQLLQPGDLLIFNNTRVIPARLFGYKETGGKVEILIERLLEEQHALAHVRASKPPLPGSKIKLEKEFSVRVGERRSELFELQFLTDQPLLKILDAIGHMPLPPYLNRADETADRECYQTVYAKHPGAVAAPTAGLHFDEKLLTQLTEKGIQTAFVTLHVGAGTFQPVRVEKIEQHVMHSEYAVVSEEVCKKIQQTKARNGRVIAVGTTSVRCLETAAQQGMFQPFKGQTQIFIYPGYQFHCIDALITNFHLPKSTLLMLVCAFAGHEKIMAAYQEAISNQYRFYSYGDAMWVA